MKKDRKIETSSSESEETDNNLDQDLINLGGELSSRIVAFEQNTIRRQIIKSKLAKKWQVFTLPIILVNRPPVHPTKRQRPLEICEPHNVYVQNLKQKMKINTHATMVPYLVMVDLVECSHVNVFDFTKPREISLFCNWMLTLCRGSKKARNGASSDLFF